jgi:aminopeptidase N
MFLSFVVHRLWILVLLAVGPVLHSQDRDTAESREPSTACAMKASMPLAAPTPAEFADPNIDALYYSLDLRLDPVAGVLSGSVTMDARAEVDPLEQVFLDLAMPMVVDSVSLDGRAVPFVRYPEGLEISLPSPRARGTPLTTRVVYHGTPRITGFGSFIFGAHSGTPWVWSLSQPYGARDWWPCKDHPIDKADSVEIRVRCPSGLLVGANGTLVGVEDHGDGTSSWIWSERYPISTYLVSIAVTNYARFSNWYHYAATDSMEILNFVLPEHWEDAQASLPRTIRMLEIYAQLFGEYPFITEKYGHAEFGRGGAMEHQTMTSTTTFNENTIAHELAHQWFGDMITCASWQDLWLNEGFATYAEALYREAEYGPADYTDFMALTLGSAQTAEGTLFVQDTTTVRALFAYPRVYAKGASVLHMLRGVLGDSLFFASLRAYAADPRLRFSTATTADFQEVCEATSGLNLDAFFMQWVFGERYPVYQLSWSAEATAAGYDVRVTIDQTTGTANPPFFAMPVELRMEGMGQDTTVRVQHTFSGQGFIVQTGFEPEEVSLDPDNWILKEVREGSSLLPVRVALAQNYPNPFNPGTSIQFDIPGRASVTLEVMDLLGRHVATLAEGTFEPGTHTVRWDGTGSGGHVLASGIYVYRLRTGGTVASRHMLLLR